MKLLKSKIRKPKPLKFKLSELPKLDGRESHEEVLKTGEMLNPIEVEDRRDMRFDGIRYGAGGTYYVHQDYIVVKGNSRVAAAEELGYTHIEGIWYAR